MPDKIPKIIHYCWFGGNPLPESAKRCIESWKKFCPDYEIKRWDETNYDVNSCEYSRGAYKAKKWAFVSDYARFDILNAEGGIYLDTDVELIGTIDDMLVNEVFTGNELATEAGTGKKKIRVAPGLILGSMAQAEPIKAMIDYYNSIPFVNGSNQKTVCDYFTELLCKYGYKYEDVTQELPGIKVYASEYFCPLNNMTSQLTMTENTRSIHWYDASWMTKSGKAAIRISRATQGKGKAIDCIGTAISIPFRLINRIETNGFKNTIKYIHSDL